MRNWIISNVEYNRYLRPVLIKRNSTKENDLDEDENLILDNVGRFCAILVRILSYSESREMQDIEEWELRIWNKILHGRFWIRELIYTQRRAELYKHIAKHWNELFPLGASEEFDPNRKIYD